IYTIIDSSSPLYLHPSDNTTSVVVEKLQGTSNYRSWRRDLEISLASKRKLGFVTGGVKKDETDPVKKECWETCNNMVISWILHSVTDSIKKSIMFMTSAKQMWDHLEKRFSITDGAKKYSLNKQIYDTRQQGRLVSEYYTDMKALWEELESLNMLPALSETNQEITTYVNAIQKQQEEQKLFQFLSGLDEGNGAQRSQILLMNPLPSVDETCNMIQQEESQREIFKHETREETGVLAMYGKRSEVTCSNCGKNGHLFDKCWACKVCGKRGHSVEECWHVKGFPSKNDKGKNKVSGPRSMSIKGKDEYARDQNFKSGSKWDRNKQGGKRMAGNVKMKTEAGESNSSNNVVTAQQLEQFLKMLPSLSKGGGTDTEDEMENNYSGMVTCNLVQTATNEWIIDSGATHHMTSNKESMTHVCGYASRNCINFPTGETTQISGIGEVRLSNDMVLSKVMLIPSFKHSLLSVQKLSKENNCKVTFHVGYCFIQDQDTSEVKGIGRAKNGLYYLINLPVKKAVEMVNFEAFRYIQEHKEKSSHQAMTVKGKLDIPGMLEGGEKMSKLTLWHRRMGHAPDSVSLPDQSNEHYPLTHNNDDISEESLDTEQTSDDRQLSQGEGGEVATESVHERRSTRPTRKPAWHQG
ncbi:Retrovirus-related Pol polyprotein from transposon RE2, partial [Bienertia sinuspersici]